MNSRRFTRCGLFLLLSFLGAQCTRAQDAQPQEPQSPESAPKPAARATFPTIDPDQSDQNQEPNALQPDLTPLTGLEDATLGIPQFQHSYWVPGLQFASTVQRNPSFGSSSSDWFAYSHFLGNLTLLKAWSRSTLSLNYSGGGFVSSGTNSLNTNNRDWGWSSQLAIGQTFQLNRWIFNIFDRFSYLPTTLFGYGTGTNLGIPGVGGALGGLGGLGGLYVPNQSIFTTNGPIYSNAGVVEATYTLSRRSSITTAGSYGILRFVDPGNVDSDMILGSVGYNHAISAKDEIGVVYRFASFHYAGIPQAYGNHTVSAAYSRKITGRLALRIHAGPQFTTYRIPQGTDSNTYKVGFNSNVNLNYAVPRGSVNFNYTHGLSGGSGVLVGSNLDQVNFMGTRELSRIWSGNIHFGYAHNASLTSSGQFARPDYNSFYAGAGVNRPIGRHMHMGVTYAAHFTKNSSVGCVGSNCDNSFTIHVINLSLQWHTRPFVLE